MCPSQPKKIFTLIFDPILNTFNSGQILLSFIGGLNYFNLAIGNINNDGFKDTTPSGQSINSSTRYSFSPFFNSITESIYSGTSTLDLSKDSDIPILVDFNNDSYLDVLFANAINSRAIYAYLFLKFKVLIVI